MREQLKNIAFEARDQYKAGFIDRNEAKRLITPYIEYFNEFSKKTAAKYGISKPKTINFASFVR
jgi:hypothetical protein